MTSGSKVFRIGPTARNMSVIFDRGSLNANDLYSLALSATPLTFSIEYFYICNSVCLEYVDGKKLSVFQVNVKYLKLKNIPQGHIKLSKPFI